jgi:hypothetical protein
VTLTRVELGSGREIKLSELHLESTYGGLIEGYPFAGLNDRIVGRLAERAGRLLPHAPVHVVDPPRSRPDREASRPLPFGPEEWLPDVICMGRFSSAPVDARLDPVLHYSRLVVVWFQDEADIPAGRQVPAALDALHWDDWAEDDEV